VAATAICGLATIDSAYTAAMRFDRRSPEVAPMILQLGERAFLVDAHQAAVSSHIRGKNGRKVTFWGKSGSRADTLNV
jgi:hypothetical protein